MAESPDDKPDDAALRARLAELSRTLDKEEAVPASKSPVEDKSMAGAMSLGFRVLTEFVAGVAVGGLIGWQLDKWLKTSPALLIVFLALGTAAGFWNVYRLAMPNAGGRRRPPL